MKAVKVRLEEIVSLHGLTPRAYDQLQLLVEILAEPHAPSAITDRQKIVDLHIADSLTALDIPYVCSAESIVDIGAGAGVPGLALAVVQLNSHIYLLESSKKKCGFISEAAEALSLENVTVVNARVEEWAELRGKIDVVCARAVASLSVLCEYSAPLLSIGGYLVAWKGKITQAEEDNGAYAASQTGLEYHESINVTPFDGSKDRILRSYRKTRETPTKFPRRPGIATKRPLTVKR